MAKEVYFILKSLNFMYTNVIMYATYSIKQAGKPRGWMYDGANPLKAHRREAETVPYVCLGCQQY